MGFTQKNFAPPLAFIGIMFLVIEFALGINSVLTPILQGSSGITPAEFYLIIAATLIPFLILGHPTSMTTKAIGYKRTMALSFTMSVIVFGLYILSAGQESPVLFPATSFVNSTADAFLQASVSPYITTLDPLDSATKRISVMGICNKLTWPVPPLFLAFLVGKGVNDTIVSDLFTPLRAVIVVFILLGIVSLTASLPEVKATGEDDSEDGTKVCPYTAGKMSIWQLPHPLLECLALFLYVGVETVSLGALTNCTNSLHLENAAACAWIAPIGIVTGYICGITSVPKYLNQTTALKICSILATAGSILAVLTPVGISIHFVALIALGYSLMWSALWPLAMADLDKFIEAGSSLLIMAMAGGAVIPTLSGYIKDIAGAQNAYRIYLPCFLFILYYGMTRHKIRTK